MSCPVKFFVIDAYNLLFKTRRPDHFSEKGKRDFILFLDEWMGSLKLKGVLIFDSNPNHSHAYPTKSALSNLEVIHSPIHVEGDLYILEYLSIIKNPSYLRLVTSDKALAKSARDLKVETLSSSEFFNLLGTLSTTKETIRKEQKPLFESKKELERLQKIFEDTYTTHLTREADCE